MTGGKRENRSQAQGRNQQANYADVAQIRPDCSWASGKDNHGAHGGAGKAGL